MVMDDHAIENFDSSDGRKTAFIAPKNLFETLIKWQSQHDARLEQ
jgi:hypothetical protein